MNKPDLAALESTINTAFDNRDSINTSTRGEIRDAVEEALNLLDNGNVRVAQKGEDGNWHVNQWLKKSVLLSFRLNAMEVIKGGPGDAHWWDKVPSKFNNWSTHEFEKAGFRAVPGSIVRRSAYIAPNVVLMPSFVNLGAHIGEGTMVDTWATVGSCAQIGRDVHLSGGVGIGEGSVLGMGVYIGQSTRIVDRETGSVTYGEVPPYSVVVAGSMPGSKSMGNGVETPHLYCAVIVKRVDEKTRSKTGINELLRD